MCLYRLGLADSNINLMSYAILLLAFILTGCSIGTAVNMECDGKCRINMNRDVDNSSMFNQK